MPAFNGIAAGDHAYLQDLFAGSYLRADVRVRHFSFRFYPYRRLIRGIESIIEKNRPADSREHDIQKYLRGSAYIIRDRFYI